MARSSLFRRSAVSCTVYSCFLVVTAGCDSESSDDDGVHTRGTEGTGAGSDGQTQDGGTDAMDAADSDAVDGGAGVPGCGGGDPACEHLCNLVCGACGSFTVQENQCDSFQNGGLDGQTCLSCKSQIAMWAVTCETMSEAPIPDSDPASCPDDVERGPQCQALYTCCLTAPPEQAPACENTANGGNEAGCQISADMQYC